VRREVLAQATEWRQQRTKKLYASLAWVYAILHARTGCTMAELHALFRGLLVRPLVPASALMPPQGASWPSHLLWCHPCPQPLLAPAVLAAFGVTPADLARSTEAQVRKALAALELAQADPTLEDRLCSLLDQASALMLGADFLGWL